jgi:hypothetical protein
MSDLGRHRGKHHSSLLSLTPITFDANTFSCCGGSYFATIAVFYHLPKTSELGRATTAHITIVVYFRDHYHWFSVCSFAELSSAFIIPPLRALQSSTSTIHTFYLQGYITRAWGMPTSFFTHLYIISHLVEGRIYRFLSSPTDCSIRSHSFSPLQHYSQSKKH